VLRYGYISHLSSSAGGPFTSPVKILQSLCLLGEGSGETSFGRYLNILSELVSMHFFCQVVAFLPTEIEEL
jgi:hypothetical protein